MDDEKQIKKMNYKLQLISHFPEQIIKLWILSQKKNQSLLTKCLLDNNDNIKQIINTNLVFFLKKNIKLWDIVEEIDEDTFNYIIDNNLYYSIEHCKSVLNNAEYIKKLLDKNNKSVLWFIDESVFFELVRDDKYKDKIFKFVIESTTYDRYYHGYREEIGHINFLNSDKAFIHFVNEFGKDGLDYKKIEIMTSLFTKVSDEYLTKEKVLSVSLNTGQFYSQYEDNTYFNRLCTKYFGEEYASRLYESKSLKYSRSEDIKKIIELGFIPSKSTLIAHEDDYDVFIENNFFNVISDDNIRKNSLVAPNYNTIQLAIKKGFDLFNISYLVDYLQEKNLSSILDEYKTNDVYKNFLCFLISTNYDYHVFNFVKSVNDINSLFDSNGITKEFIDRHFFPNGSAGNYYANFLKEENLKLLYNDSRVISYVKLFKKIFFSYGPKEKYFSYIRSVSDIEKYFDDKGPNSNFLIEYISYSETLENIDIFYERYPSITGYSKYIKEKNVSSSIYEFYKFVNDRKVELDKEILDLLLFKNTSYFFDKNGVFYLQYNDEPIIQNYINFLNDNNINYEYELSSIIKSKDDIKKYFTENGIKDELYEKLLLFKSNYSNFKALLMKHYSDSKYVQYYLEYKDTYGMIIDDIDTISDIKKYFSDDGITADFIKKVFEKGNKNLKLEILNLMLDNSYYENIFSNGTCEYSYLKFCKEEIDNENLYFGNIDDVVSNDFPKYFDENGPKKIFYIDLFKNKESSRGIINYFLADNKFEIAFNKESPEYQLFNFYVSNRSSKSYDNTYSIIFLDLNTNDLNLYFGKNGPTKNLILKFLKQNNCEWLAQYKSILRFDVMNNITEENVGEYFDENGITDKFINERILKLKDTALFTSLNYLYEVGCERIVNNKIIINYLDFENKYMSKSQYSDQIIHNIDGINNFFDETGPKKILFELGLCDGMFFNNIFKSDKYYNDYITRFNPSDAIKSYIQFIKENGFILGKLIKKPSDIENYFEKEGPKIELYEEGLTDKKFFKCLFETDKYLNTKFKPSIAEQKYIQFIKENGFILEELVKNPNDIENYFDENGPSEELKLYFKNNPDFTNHLLSNLVHNDTVLNNLTIDFVNMFEYYLLDKYFNNSKEKYDYLFSKIGPKLLFGFDNNVLKLINCDVNDMEKFFKLFEFEKGVIPEQETYNNFVISLCNMSFKKNHSYITNIFTNIKELIRRIKDLDGFINGTTNGGLNSSLYHELTSVIDDISTTLKIDKSIIYSAIRECKKLNEDPLHDICRKYLEECQKKFLDDNGDKVLSTIGVTPVIDSVDATKKLCTHLLNTITYDNFILSVENIKTKINYESRKGFIDEIKMTKEEFDILISINREQFILIVDAIRNKKAPDASVKKQFSLFKRFMMQYSKFNIDNNLVTSQELNNLNVNNKYQIESRDIDYLLILSELDLDVLFNYDEDILNSLIRTIKTYRLGSLPLCTTNGFNINYGINLPNGINNIGLFITRYIQLLKNKKERLRKLNYNVKLKDITFSFEEIVKLISSVNSETYELKRLIGNAEYFDFINNAGPNSSSCSRKVREEKMALIVDYLYSLGVITIPSHDMILDIDNGKEINIIVGNRTNPANICHGERTGACMRVGGVGESLFLKCITDKNWFHIRLEDPVTHEYISRVSGFRNGNTVYLNQLRNVPVGSKYTNEDLQKFIKKYAEMLIEETKNSKFPIENVFINTGYAMSYASGTIYHFGERIQSDYNLSDVQHLILRGSSIYTDVRNNALLLATTEEGVKTKEGYAPLKNGPENAEVYSCVRDKIYGLNDIDDDRPKHLFVIIDSELLMEKINRVNTMKQKLVGIDYKYKIEDVSFGESGIIDGYVSSDWYVYIDCNYEIHTDYIENIYSHGEMIQYPQLEQAKQEMEYIKKVLINKYSLTSEVKYAI